MGSKDINTFMGVVADCLKGKGCFAVRIRAQKAEDIISFPPITVSEDTTLIDISNTFKERKINTVLVVDKRGNLVGIVSRGDVVEGSPVKGKS